MKAIVKKLIDEGKTVEEIVLASAHAGRGFIPRKGIITMDYYDFVASAIAAVASLYNANAELAHLQKIGVKDVCVLWCGSTLQNNKAWLSTTVPDCMYYEATYDGDKKELRLDAYRKIQSVSIPC